ncbi:hypothetical protein ACH41H_37335 [Streptomyces sp. NPDC020800]|uniref:hypothetical protein n=1 Tax=Streptomyces sp. NPDC020800 TaxID=3365092 RepID=UPI0037AA16DB
MYVDRSAGWPVGRFGVVVVACVAQFSVVGWSAVAEYGIRSVADGPDAGALTAASAKGRGGNHDDVGKDIVAAGNSYGDWNSTWKQWLAHSGAGVPTTA